MDQEWTWTGSGSGPELDNLFLIIFKSFLAHWKMFDHANLQQTTQRE